MKIAGEIIGRLISVLLHKGLLTDSECTFILSPLSEVLVKANMRYTKGAEE